MKPAPYAADTRAKGWRFELDMEAVKASDTWLRARTGAIKGALLLLWSEAWQQTPCGSLPNDDELVALLIDMPAAAFTKSRAVLMRGWSLADDGRLYHETITRRVLAMLEKRAKDAKRTADRRERAAGSASGSPVVTGVSRVTPALPTREFDTKHQAPSTSSKEKKAQAPAVTGLEAVPEQVMRDFMTLRRAKRLPLTQTAVDGLAREAERAGLSVAAAIKTSVENSWAGFKAEWLMTEKQKKADVARSTVPADPREEEAAERRRQEAVMTPEQRASSDKARRLVMTAFRDITPNKAAA